MKVFVAVMKIQGCKSWTSEQSIRERSGAVIENTASSGDYIKGMLQRQHSRGQVN